MDAKEFKMAFALAKSNADFSNVNIDHLSGYGLKDFQPVTTTLEAVAKIMRWQALHFNGSWDMEELDGIKYVGKKKFEIIDGEFSVVPGVFNAKQITAIRVAARMFESEI